MPYFLSLEHDRLKTRFGKKGEFVGDMLGVISGWGFFCCWIGLWVSPQNRLYLGSPLIILSNYYFTSPGLILSIYFLVPAFWLGFKGVIELGIKVSETHRPIKIVTTGIYELVRHPQYLGGLLGHVGISFLASAWYSLLSTPLMIVLILIISWKEEKELIREFGKEYEYYRRKVPMLVPRLGANIPLALFHS